MMATKRTVVTAGSIGLAVVLGAGGGAAVATSMDSLSSAASSTRSDDVSVIQTNSNGQTYGSLFGLTNEDAPDLVSVQMADGSLAYVYSSELFEAEGGMASSPDEALAYERSRDTAGPISITAYEADGVTVVGQWFLGGVDHFPSEFG